MRFLLMLLATGFLFTSPLLAQEEADVSTYHFDGQISVTNNGFSLVPTFSLGKPALIADVTIGGKRFSFDPQFRFDLNGLRPWSFIFIWRYKVINTEKWLFRTGIHLPAIAFNEATYLAGTREVDGLVPKRFITPEITATYKLHEKISLGVYYLYGIGLEKEDQTRHTHFISANASFSSIGITEKTYLKFNPQVYYLTLDGTGGFYTAYTIEFIHGDFPLSIGSMMNIELSSDIDTDPFEWNVSLIYSFKNQFTRKKN